MILLASDVKLFGFINVFQAIFLLLFVIAVVILVLVYCQLKKFAKEDNKKIITKEDNRKKINILMQELRKFEVKVRDTRYASIFMPLVHKLKVYAIGELRDNTSYSVICSKCTFEVTNACTGRYVDPKQEKMHEEFEVLVRELLTLFNDKNN